MLCYICFHVVGSKTQGTWGAVKGFGAGLGVGVVGGLGMMVGGAVTGVTQIGRGIINTPSSIAARYPPSLLTYRHAID